MPVQRISTSAVLTTILLLTAGLFLTSPYQLWIAMALLGVVTGILFRSGQRHVITGFGLGIAITLVREIFMYDASLIKVTAPVYAAGYLFAVAGTLTARGVLSKIIKPKMQTA